MAALLTSETSKPDSVVKYIGECREMGIAVEPPDVQVSGAQFTPHVTESGKQSASAWPRSRTSAATPSNPSSRRAKKLAAASKALWEFCEKVDLRLMNKRVIESLIKAGALDSMGKRGPAHCRGGQGDRARPESAEGRGARGRPASSDCLTKRPRTAPATAMTCRTSPTGKRAKPWPTKKRSSASSSPAIRSISTQRRFATCPASSAPRRRWNANRRNAAGARRTDPADEVQVAGIIHGLRVQKSRRDQKLYAQATLEDAAGKIDLICFSRDYERLQNQLKIEAPVLVRGVLMGDDDAASKISVSQIQALEAVQVKLPEAIRIRLNLDRTTEETFTALKSAADAAPGPGKVMLHLKKAGEYEVILEPEGMSVAADRG